MTRRMLLGYPLFSLWAKPTKRKSHKKYRKPRTVANYASPFKAVPRVSQEIQNKQADADGLERLTGVRSFVELKEKRSLIPLPIVPGLGVKNLDLEWRFCRPWVAQFIENLGALHEKYFPKTTLFITEAVRTPQKQRWLARINPNAGAIDNSVHLTGAVIDITKADMSYEQVLWMRQILFPLHEKVIYVVEEFEQPCFHIMVYKNYQKPANW